MIPDNLPLAKRHRVLVLLASYNGEKWITEQLNSILAQESVDIEIHISDDRSTDATVSVIRERYGEDARIHLTVWAQPSGSAGANFRHLFREVSTSGYSYVALADQDDIWHPDKLRTAVEAMEKSNAWGYSCAVRSFWEDGREKTVRQNAKIRLADYLLEGAGQGCTFVLRNEFFCSLQRFCSDNQKAVDALHYHDWLIYLVARVQGLRWYFDQTPWIRYRQHGGNEIGSRGGIGSVSRRLDLIRNGWYGGQVKAALELESLLQIQSPATERFAFYFKSNDSVFRKLWLTVFFLRNGRRRMTDRIVLACSAIFGWV